MTRTIEDYRESLEVGLEFEDFVCDVIHNKRGITIGNYASRRSISRGENRAGFEIKYDRKFHKTGNLFIETRERATSSSAWKGAGIFASTSVSAERPLGDWLYIIGNRSVLFAFSFTALRFLYSRTRDGRPLLERKLTDTAEGFLLPDRTARRFAAFVIDVPGGLRSVPT